MQKMTPVKKQMMKMVTISMVLIFGATFTDVKAGAIPDVKKLSDISYGDDKKQKMDVYLSGASKNAPIIIMVHGGAWSIGDKSSPRVVANKVKRWVSKGAIFVSVNYRLLPEADPLKQAEDVAGAVMYVQSHAKLWGGDASKIVLMGHSAGAHLITLVSADISKYSGLKPWLGSISLDSAAMDVSKAMLGKHYAFYDEAFGSDVSYWKDASPYYRLSQSSLPLLMVCSTVRPDKPCEDAKLMEQKAKRLSVKAEILPEALSHGDINEQLGLENEYTKKVEEFMRHIGFYVIN